LIETNRSKKLGYKSGDITGPHKYGMYAYLHKLKKDLDGGEDSPKVEEISAADYSV
jgi:hypothetical protein